MNEEKNRFNVEEHTTLDGRIIDVFPISHRYIHNLEQQVKKQKEVIDKIIEFIKSSQCKYDGWEIANQLYENEIKQLLDMLKEVSEWD